VVRVNANQERETATGPVAGYVARRSAMGTKTDTPIIETPQSISVVTRHEMDARAVTSVREALGYVPGVQVEQSVDLRDEWFQIRGFDSTQNLYRDGLRMGLASAGYANGELNPYGLERIEVLRGPSSVLYGQTGPGGIVNVVTKRPTAEQLRELELSAGSFGNKQAAFDWGSCPSAWCKSTARRELRCAVLSEPQRTAEWAQYR
jgi:iron complex outermembrane receptor protein